MSDSQVHCSIDLDGVGAAHGHFRVPYSYDLAGWACQMIPISLIAAGDGPTVLLMAGNHGDEYPGPVAIMNLCRSLKPDEMNGRLIMIPALNLPAVRASTRLSPLDGRNLNRSFPGQADGTVTEMIAHFLTNELFPRADAVIDLHTGGRGMNFAPCAHMHLVENLDQRRAMVSATEAYNTEFSFLYADIAGTGLLPVEAENQGKTVVTTEMGGGEPVSAEVHRITQEGLRNVLVHLGVLKGSVQTRADLGLPPTRWVQALDRDDYLMAPESGIWECRIDVGREVPAGACLGRIHFLEQPLREPLDIRAASAGILLGNRAPSLVRQGDCVACVAHEVDRQELLTE